MERYILVMENSDLMVFKKIMKILIAMTIKANKLRILIFKIALLHFFRNSRADKDNNNNKNKLGHLKCALCLQIFKFFSVHKFRI